MAAMRAIPTAMFLCFVRFADAAQSCVVQESDQQLEEAWDEERDQHVLLLQSEFSMRKKKEADGALATTVANATQSFILEDINHFLAEKVTKKLTVGLSEIIKEKGDDPMAYVSNSNGLEVADLTGLSDVQVTSLTLNSIGLGISTTTGTTGSVSLSLAAEIPAMNAKAERHGLLGALQVYGLSIPGLTIWVEVSGSASVVDGSLAISSIQVPGLAVNIPGIIVNVQQGEGYVQNVLSEELNAHKDTLAQKVSGKMQGHLQQRLDNLLPIPLLSLLPMRASS